MPEKPDNNFTRRDALKTGMRAAALVALGGLVDWQIMRGGQRGTVWQLDPYKCIQCDKCATACVMDISAVKCVKNFKALCGYCRICWAYLADERAADNEGAENQRCPTNAIKRSFVEFVEDGTPRYEYAIDEKLCIGCGLCVKACKIAGNKAMYLQVRHDRCLNCNRCTIAAGCPAQAFSRVPVDHPYMLKDGSREEA